MVYEYQRQMSPGKWQPLWRIAIMNGRFSDLLSWLTTYQQYYTEEERFGSRFKRLHDDSGYEYVFDGTNRHNHFKIGN